MRSWQIPTDRIERDEKGKNRPDKEGLGEAEEENHSEGSVGSRRERGKDPRSSCCVCEHGKVE